MNKIIKILLILVFVVGMIVVFIGGVNMIYV